MQWFYVDQNQERQPFDETALGEFVKDGTIGCESLLWNETMKDWQAAGDLFPAWFPAATTSPLPAPQEPLPQSGTIPTEGEFGEPELPSLDAAPAVEPSQSPVKIFRTKGRPAGAGSDQREMIKDFASYLNANRGWIKFFGVLSIIQGSIMCLSIVGALVGWLPIWLGVTVFKSAKAADLAERTGSREHLEESLYRLGFFFKLNGIVVVVVFVFFAAVAAITVFTGVVAAVSSGLGAG